MPAAGSSARSRRRVRANGEGGIREDKSHGRWVGTVTIGWADITDGNGRIRSKQLRRSVVGKSKRDVLRRMREVQRLTDINLPVPPKNLTVGAMLELWLNDVLPGTVSAVTEGQYRQVVRLYLGPRLGQRKLSELSPLDVTRMLPRHGAADCKPAGWLQPQHASSGPFGAAARPSMG